MLGKSGQSMTLLIQIQMAVVGIVVVAGFFYLWRMISRIEERLSQISFNQTQTHCAAPISSNSNSNINNIIPECVYNKPAEYNQEDDINDAADELMKQVFGASSQNDLQPTMVMFSMSQNQQLNPLYTSNVQVEEIDEESDDDSEENKSVDDEQSQGSQGKKQDEHDPLSKNKLKNMNVDTLKKLCVDRGLSSEGKKDILVNRLLGLDR